MDHNEAITSMAAERYLLNDMTPELRDAFEEHLFDCADCAVDIRAGAAFVEGARAHLPALTASTPSIGSPVSGAKRAIPKKSWIMNLQAAFAVPAFAALLALVGYQNLSTIPHLRASATEPRLAPWTAMHVGTRGGEGTSLAVKRDAGAVILIDLPQDSGYTSYAFELVNSGGKTIWSRSETASGSGTPGSGTLSLLIPGRGLDQGTYALVISGVNAQGERAQIDRRTLDLHFED